MKKVNPKRKQSEWERAYGSEERVQWIQGLPSHVSGQTPCVNAHVPPKGDSSGMSRKPDARWIVPLTDAEHRELHRIGRETFEARHEVNLAEAAAMYDTHWRTRG